MKKCSVCGIEKDLNCYNQHPETKDKLYTFCKDCRRIKTNEYRKRTDNKSCKAYEKTPKGYLVRTYRNMKSRVTGVQTLKAHLYGGKELLDKESFYQWALMSEDYIRLYNAYISGGCQMKFAPSIDRIDSSKGYTFDNIRWITHSENSRNGSLSKNR